jgi:multimeric flavodoxin WrbA
MKICVLNGSPKGRQSITLQYVRFLELAFPSHTFVIEDVAQHIAATETDEKAFAKVIASVSSAGAVLFATPVYYLLVPAQLKRFIELVFTRNAGAAFSGKYAASLTTSVHFFDHTANAYLHAVGEDLGMKWAGSFMAKSDDLLSEKHQRDLVLFAEDFFTTAATGPELQREFPPVTEEIPEYRPGPVPLPFDAGGKNVVILSDAAPGSNLEKMVGRAASCFGTAASIVPLGEAGMKGGCLGCCRCAFDNTCAYTDGYREFFDGTILPADIVIFAGPVRDRFLSARFKQFFDRSFFLGHVPYLAGKQVAFLVGGPLAGCSTLREFMTAYAANLGAGIAGVVSDESPTSGLTDARIDALCRRCIRLSQTGYIAPPGFPAAGGRKVLRDEIWGGMRAVFKADDAYFRAHGMYDFPQSDSGNRIRTSLFSLFLALPPVRKEAEQRMKEHMIEPFARVFSDSPVLRERMKKA